MKGRPKQFEKRVIISLSVSEETIKKIDRKVEKLKDKIGLRVSRGQLINLLADAYDVASQEGAFKDYNIKFENNLLTLKKIG